MLRLQQVVLREVRLPLREPFRISSGVTRDRRILLLQLRDADGVEAWSECVAGAAPHYSPETIDTAWVALLEWLVPRVLDRAFSSPKELFPSLDEGFRGHRMAKAALEMGAWALAAEQEARPLAELLGGTRDRVATGISIGIQEDPAAVAAKATSALEEGYRKVKMKIRPGADLEYVRAVREAVGADAPVAVDANAAYTPEDTGSLEALDELGLLMIEQPYEAGDLVRHADLQRRLRTPLCLDESLTSPARVEDMIRLESARIVNLKPGRVGGFGPSLRIHELCRDHEIPLWCGGMLETGVGRAYNVALASLPQFRLPGDLSPSRRYWEKDVVEPEWTMDPDGWVEVPRDRPGLGVEVDVERLEALTVRTERVGR